MKVELVGINKEDTYGAPAAGGPYPIVDAPTEPERKTLVVARFSNLPDGTYINLNVPYEMVRGAEVGDVFILHLERRPPATGANN